MKIDCTSNNGGPCLTCEAFMAGHEVGTRAGLLPLAALDDKLRVMHRRAQKAEGELAKIGGEPGGLARLRAAKDWAAHWERRALVAEAKLAEARDTEVALRMALHGDAASETIRRLRRRAQKAEGAIRAVERRAEGLCRDAERRVTEEARVRGLYRKKMRACSDMICESGLVQCETPARDGWPRCVEGRLEVLVPRLIAECERLRGEVTRLSGRASYDDVCEGGGANAG